MADPVPQTLSRHFTNLVGRKVTFTKPASRADTAEKKIFAVYKSFPSQHSIVLKADLPLLGAFAGSLVGMPDSEVRSRVAEPTLDDLLKDAISEILNVAAAAIATEDRATFASMAVDPSGLEESAREILSKPHREFAFDVTVEDYRGGRFNILI
jgi:hypothetical protein